MHKHRAAFIVLILLGTFFLSSVEVDAVDPNTQPNFNLAHKFLKVEGSPYLGHWMYDGEVHEAHLLSFAENDHIPAMVDAARRYLSGDGVERNLGTAWYWLKRAQQTGFDISPIMPKSLNQLLMEMDEHERYALSYFAHHHEGLDLSGIEIPPLFGPLTSEIPEPLSDREVGAFVEKFKGLNRKDHNKAYMNVETELAMRTTGIRFVGNVSIDGQLKPLGMNDDEFARRKCNYHRAIAKIFPHRKELKGEQLRRKDDALMSLLPKDANLFQKDVAVYVRDVLRTGRICPNSESEGMLEALAWANKLEKMTADDLRILATDHFEKSGTSYNERYEPDLDAADLDAEIERLRHNIVARTIVRFAEAIQPPPKDDRAYRSKLIYMAAHNELEAQLDLARHLETGDNFKQDTAKAYFWYQRAHENGGGEAAKAGMDRLLPQMRETDFVAIDLWLKYGNRPY